MIPNSSIPKLQELRELTTVSNSYRQFIEGLDPNPNLWPNKFDQFLYGLGLAIKIVPLHDEGTFEPVGYIPTTLLYPWNKLQDGNGSIRWSSGTIDSYDHAIRLATKETFYLLESKGLI